MTRRALEHIIRASAAIADTPNIVVIGSQSILAQHPDAPGELLVSIEADVYPKDDPARADLIDGAIGERSLFHETYGYYAHGVGPETAIVPEGAYERLVPISNENTQLSTGWCLEAHDLIVSKLAAGREKDLDFVASTLRHRLVEPARIAERIAALPDSHREMALDRFRRIQAA
jgi:hypothetical protein